MDISTSLFTTVTYKQFALDHEKARFILVDPYKIRPTFAHMLDDIIDWNMPALTINEYDYTKNACINYGYWVLSPDSETSVLFNLKYKKYIIIDLTYAKLKQCMGYAHSRVSKMGKITRSDGVDYMYALSRVSLIKQTYLQYSGLR